MAYIENPIVEGKDFESVMNDVNGNFDNSKYVTETVFGVYTGNGESERFINIGFTPIAVEIHRYDGSQGCKVNDYYAMSDIAGGFALNGYDCYGEHGTAIKIVENGFSVRYNDPGTSSYQSGYCATNEVNMRYYFKAYKAIVATPTILEIN